MNKANNLNAIACKNHQTYEASIALVQVSDSACLTLSSSNSEKEDTTLNKANSVFLNRVIAV